MRGAEFHNQFLVRQPGRELEKLGAKVFWEYPTRIGRYPRYIDAYAELGQLRIGLEGESKPWNVWNAVSKAEELRLLALLIITPTGHIARAAKCQLTRCAHCTPENLRIVVLPLGTALQVLTNKSLLMSVLNVRETYIQKIPPLSPTAKTKGECV